MNETLLFLDTEFTGLTKTADLISVGIVSFDGTELYLERSDYDQTLLTDWVIENVIPLLTPGQEIPAREICREINSFLAQYENPVIIVDSQWDITVLKKMYDQCHQQLAAKFRIIDINNPRFINGYDNYLYSKTPHVAITDAHALRAGYRAQLGYYI